jgi:hypothetical protein
MKTKLFFLIAIIISAFSFQSCKDDPVEPKESESQIWPLAIGNYWTYSHLDKNDSSFVDSVFVVKDTTIEGEKWFVVVMGDEDGNLWRNSAIGLLSKTKDSTYRLLVKYPTNVGDKTPDDEDTLYTVAKNVSITVPAGTFSTIKYEFIGEDIEEEYEYYRYTKEEIYMAPGVGLVKYYCSRKDSVNGELYHYHSYELTKFRITN